jgi:hypothetical protein
MVGDGSDSGGDYFASRVAIVAAGVEICPGDFTGQAQSFGPFPDRMNGSSWLSPW